MPQKVQRNAVYVGLGTREVCVKILIILYKLFNFSRINVPSVK